MATNPQTISGFISNFNGGLRNNRFRVSGSVGNNTPTLTFHVKSTSLPSSSITPILVPYRGRSFKMPGNRSYPAWQISVLDDITGNNSTGLWRQFHNWSQLFNTHTGNISQTTNPDMTDKMKDWTVEHLDINGNPVKKIQLKYCWPSEVGPIALTMDENETLTTFSVTLDYSWFDVLQ